MRSFDFAPLYRSSVGFDQIANMMDRVLTNDGATPSYPPYNIDLSVEVREKALIVSARKADEDEAKTYLHRGIATRAFERRFHLADHVQVIGAAHANGMLHIELERQVPEALKPRQIAISSEVKAIDKDVVDAKSVN